MRISEFIEQCNRTNVAEVMLSLMERAASELGFDRYAYCALTGHDRYLSGGNPAPAVALNFPTSWTDYYFERDYQTIDPVVQYAPKIEGPFLWDSLSPMFRLTRTQSLVMHQASEARLRNGVGVPLHGPFGNVCLLTFAAGDGHPDAEIFLSNLGVLAAQFHLAYSEIGRADISPRCVPDLSDRERECLQWLANGKSCWAVGDILNISENTVKFHMKNAFRKLETSNRVVAAVKAIRFGLISPPD